MNDCPCCTGNLLRHVRTSGIYWFCLNCRQEMPNLICYNSSQPMIHQRLGHTHAPRSRDTHLP
ncbi:MAG: hypothetical protein VKJ46_09015 [Leptolyngbyaceae bacterium]|nr:hypothetical protein [Leptolyngbyaceae bacterium]